ncbi:MAG TPA: hypothetical protein PKY59_18350 [Pyrinomonadaceae bacterium]|nr:hypothetical protein [Pyrinomonadaceae bacterium]
MKTPDYISKFEYKAFLFLVITLFSLTICSYNYYTIKENEKRDAYFNNIENGGVSFAGPYCFPDKHPGLLLINIFLAVSMLFTAIFRKTFFFSYIFSFGLIWSFVKWYFDTQFAISTNETFIAKGLDPFLYQANFFDAAIILILSIIIFWQISILLRMLIKKLNGKEILL